MTLYVLGLKLYSDRQFSQSSYSIVATLKLFVSIGILLTKLLSRPFTVELSLALFPHNDCAVVFGSDRFAERKWRHPGD